MYALCLYKPTHIHSIQFLHMLNSYFTESSCADSMCTFIEQLTGTLADNYQGQINKENIILPLLVNIETPKATTTTTTTTTTTPH